MSRHLLVLVLVLVLVVAALIGWNECCRSVRWLESSMKMDELWKF